MQLNPRYGADPIISLDGSPAAIAEPAIRQRRRLAEVLASFTDDQWAHPSRCEGWSGRDVIVHLDSTNSFWTYSIEAGIRGEPTTLLSTFDPVRSPAAFVDGSTGMTADAVLEGFTASTATLVELLDSLDDAAWSVPAEAPPGHLSVSAVAHHALWDSWVHERDILLPLGVVPAVEADEVAACLRYVAALAPAVALNGGAVAAGRLAITASDPDLDLLVEVGDAVSVGPAPGGTEPGLAGDAVDLVESLSLRRPFDQPIRGELAPVYGGLAEAFDAEPR